jgi:uncharacterized membrane protein YphA (DoxX/SURF4 family)
MPDDHRPLLPRINWWIQLGIRLILGAMFCMYGVAKLIGTQFIRSGAALDVPVGELSGFELTWVYFGYSPLFSDVIALGQISCGAMLFFDRTKRIGMLGLFPIVVNIVLVNFGFNISADTKRLSLVFLGMNLWLILSEFPDLKRFLWDEAVRSEHRPRLVERFRRTSFSLRLFLLVAVLGGSWWLISWLKARFMDENELSGDWSVTAITLADQPLPSSREPFGPAWEKLCFESGGRASIRSAQGMHDGRYALTEGAKIRLGFDPTSMPRRGSQTGETDPKAVAEETVTTLADAEELIRREREKAMPRTIEGNYTLAADRSTLEIRGKLDGQRVLIQLKPWVWRKW